MLYSGGLDSYLLSLEQRCDAYVYVHTERTAHGLKQAKQSLREVRAARGTELLVIKMPAYWNTAATKEQRFRNPLFLLAVSAHFNMGKRDTLFAAIRDAGHTYDDCSYDFYVGVKRLSISLCGPEIEFPHFFEHLSDTVTRLGVTHLPPLQSCNADSKKNCGECMKCRVIKRQLMKAKIPHAWDEMNAR
jgi:7-cyano-7-deazaguanine synthase in queuosine biosynthesis